MFRLQNRKRQQKKGEKIRTAKTEDSLGQFINFPSIIHGKARIAHENTTHKIQKAVIQVLYNLNEFKDTRPFSVTDHTHIRTYNGEIAFEVGVADGLFFDYFNHEALQKMFEVLKSGEDYTVLDFLVIVTYRYFREKRKIPLNFDYYIVRFSFYKGEVEILLFHSKGMRRMPLDDFLKIIISRLSSETKQMGLKPIKTESIRTL